MQREIPGHVQHEELESKDGVGKFNMIFKETSYYTRLHQGVAMQVRLPEPGLCPSSALPRSVERTSPSETAVGCQQVCGCRRAGTGSDGSISFRPNFDFDYGLLSDPVSPSYTYTLWFRV